MRHPAPVMVGIDGSTAAVRAALWAAEEAMMRQSSLHLVAVVDPTRSDDLDEAMARARHAIHLAWEAVSATGKQVELMTEILLGDPAPELIDAARRAALLCVGHKGTRDSAPGPRGSTALALLRAAPTSVAVVRRRHTHPPTFHRWIVAVLDESKESHAVLEAAMDEAQLRNSPVLALTSWSTTLPAEVPGTGSGRNIRAEMDRYLLDAREDPADIQVCALPLPDDLSTLLDQSAGIDQLLVLGSSRQDLVEQVTKGKVRKALHGTNCSILVVQAEAPKMHEVMGRTVAAAVG